MIFQNFKRKWENRLTKRQIILLSSVAVKEEEENDPLGFDYENSHKTACQEMKTHLNSGNNKYNVTTMNTSNYYKLHEDRMWDGKDIRYTENIKLDFVYRRKEMNQNDTSVLKILIITRFLHTIPTGCLTKEINSKSKQVIIYAQVIEEEVYQRRPILLAKNKALLSWQEEFFCLENTSFPRTGFSRDVGFL